MTNEEKKQKAESLIKELSLILEISEQDIYAAIYKHQKLKVIDYLEKNIEQGITISESIKMLKEEIDQKKEQPL